MTEVKPNPKTSGVGLYATQEYKPGQIILSEKPLVILAPQSPDQVKALRNQFQNIAVKDSDDKGGYGGVLDSTCSPLYDLDLTSSSISTSLREYLSALNDNQKNVFRGMLVAAASYALLGEKEDIQPRIFSLYHPHIIETDVNIANQNEDKIVNSTTLENTSHEAVIVTMAHHALKCLGETAKPSEVLATFVQNSPMDCVKIMLIWSCNAFKGGYVYETMSRMNHSCDFNAVISTHSSLSRSCPSSPFSLAMDQDGTMVVRSASLIQTGDEICISYLGSYTYADFVLRNERLRRDKFFECQCSRCERDRCMGDVAGSIPCPVCHPRNGSRYLEEDVQYDDGEIEVYYCVPSCRENKEEQEGDIKLSKCHDKVVYHCEKCGKVEMEPSVAKDVEKTVARALSHLDEGLEGEHQIDDDEGERETKIEMTERLACLASSVLGAKHWTTNLLTFVLLSAKLSLIHATILCKSAKGGGANDDDDDGEGAEGGLMNDVAECVDSLERIMAYVESLGLKSHVGHMVGNVAVGVARALVGFGDVKSMKYGSTFASKVYGDYFQLGFEGDAMEKVVETLMNAWKRKVGDDAKEPEQKRLKKTAS